MQQHDFILMADFQSFKVRASDPQSAVEARRKQTAALVENMPEGCEADDELTELYGAFTIRCRRWAPTLLDAVGSVVAHAAHYGVVFDDLGVLHNRLAEWYSDGRNGRSATITIQLLLMAAVRGRELGYSRDDLARLLTLATAHHEDDEPQTDHIVSGQWRVTELAREAASNAAAIPTITPETAAALLALAPHRPPDVGRLTETAARMQVLADDPSAEDDSPHDR